MYGFYGNFIVESAKYTEEEYKNNLKELVSFTKDEVSKLNKEYRSCYKVYSISISNIKSKDQAVLMEEEFSKFSTKESENDNSAKEFMKSSIELGKKLRKKCKELGFIMSSNLVSDVKSEYTIGIKCKL